MHDSPMKLSDKEKQRYLDVLAAMPDEAIDTSDIPELTEDDFRRGKRGVSGRKGTVKLENQQPTAKSE